MGGFSGAGLPPFRGALVTLGVATNITFPVLPVPFDTVSYDTSSFWDAANHQFVIPAGVTLVRLSASIDLTTSLVVGSVRCDIRNAAGSNIVGLGVSESRQGTSGFSENNSFCQSGVIKVNAGDTFRVRANSSMSGLTQALPTTQSFFSIEVIR